MSLSQACGAREVFSRLADTLCSPQAGSAHSWATAERPEPPDLSGRPALFQMCLPEASPIALAAVASSNEKDPLGWETNQAKEKLERHPPLFCQDVY